MDETNINEMRLAGARKYVKAGLQVIALNSPLFYEGEEPSCSCGRRDCGKATGKHPIRSGWQNAPLRDAVAVTTEWVLNPHANVGLVTGGASGLVVLDVDGEVGIASLSRLEEQLGKLPPTPTSITGSGGLHLLFAHPGELISNSVCRLGPGLDVRGEHGQIVAPPSVHRSGQLYRWKIAPGDLPLAQLPPAWLEAMRTAPDRGYRPSTGMSSAGEPQAGLYLAKSSSTLEEAKQTFAALLEHPLIVWMCEEPNDVSREVWRGVAVNIHAAVDRHQELSEIARQAFHAISSDYDGYSAAETARVFNDAEESFTKVGPMRFDTMINSGAPADLCTGGTALVDAARRKARRTSRSSK